jgi:hypothetical protein
VRAQLAILILVLSVNTAFGQSASEIESKFGPPIRVYSLTEHIWMTADYALDGQVCQMKLFPKRVGPNNDYLSHQLPFEELKFILNRLIPPAARGVKGKLFGFTDTGGGLAWTTYPYEKAVFTFAFRFRIDKEALKQSEPFSLSAEEMSSYRQSAKTPPSDNDFDNSQTDNLEIVTIKWTGRKCAGR